MEDESETSHTTSNYQSTTDKKFEHHIVDELSFVENNIQQYLSIHTMDLTLTSSISAGGQMVIRILIIFQIIMSTRSQIITIRWTPGHLLH